MKKIIFSLLFMILPATGFAQTTWNVRLGTGISSCGFSTDRDVLPLFVAQGQCNIPFRKGGPWTLSPSIEFSAGEETFQISLPMTIGYKKTIGQKKLLYPKFGIKIGYDDSEGWQTAVVGPTAALDFELSHFVLGLSAAYSLIEYEYFDDYFEYRSPWNLHLTFGYKF